MSTCKLCGSDRVSDFSQRDRAHRFCHACKGHEYEEQLIAKKSWDDWINGKTERPRAAASGMSE